MAAKPNTALRYALQAVNYLVLIAIIGYFSTAPAYRQLAEDQAVITIAFTHAGEVREPCRKLTQEELNALAPNMRKLEQCPRERSPVIIEARLDDSMIFNPVIEAPGLYKDGSVDVYHSAKVPAGEHRLMIKMDDNVNTDGFDHVLEQTITMKPAQIVLVGFKQNKGFIVK